MRNRTTVVVGIALVALLFPLLAAANPGTEISPSFDSHSFGPVDVGDSATVMLIIGAGGDDHLILTDIYFSSLSCPDYSFTGPSLPIMIYLPINGGLKFLPVEITFSPTDAGACNGELVLVGHGFSNTGDVVTRSIFFEGEGIGAEPVTIDSILEFFYAGVDEGSIVGVGPNCSSKRAHLKVFEFKLLMIKFGIERGWERGTCNLLWHAYERSDDQKPPKDWIEDGEGFEGTILELNNMLLQLLSDRGCL